MEKNVDQHSFAVPLVAGVMSGVNGTIIGHPFETLKTRLQVGKLLTDTRLNAGLVRQLYRGVLPPLLTTGAMNSIHFSLYEYIRNRVHNSNIGMDRNNITTIGLCGAASGMMVTLGTNPISIIKIRQQVASEQGMAKVIGDIYKQSGMKGFYRGAAAMLPLDAFRGLYFVFYELFKTQSAASYNTLAPMALNVYLDYEQRRRQERELLQLYKMQDHAEVSSEHQGEMHAVEGGGAFSSLLVVPAVRVFSFFESAADANSPDTGAVPAEHGGSLSAAGDLHDEVPHVTTEAPTLAMAAAASSSWFGFSWGQQKVDCDVRYGSEQLDAVEPHVLQGEVHHLPAMMPPLSVAPNNTIVRMLSSGAAGVCCWFLFYPIDVVKSRVHLDFAGRKYSGVLDCAVKTFRQGGVAAFYRGISFTLIRAGPVAAATLTTYETVKDMLEARAEL